MGIDTESIVRGLEVFRALPGRGERTRSASGNLLIIDDAYNANPDSVRASMRLLSREVGPRIFVLGDMAEVGDECEAVHREVGSYARELGLDALYASGENSRFATEAFGDKGCWYATKEELIAGLGSVASGTVVVKASHSMGFAEVVKALKSR